MSKCAAVTDPGELANTKPIRRFIVRGSTRRRARCRRSSGRPARRTPARVDVEQREPGVVGGQSRIWSETFSTWSAEVALASSETSGFAAFSAEIASAPARHRAGRSPRGRAAHRRPTRGGRAWREARRAGRRTTRRRRARVRWSWFSWFGCPPGDLPVGTTTKPVVPECGRQAWTALATVTHRVRYSSSAMRRTVPGGSCSRQSALHSIRTTTQSRAVLVETRGVHHGLEPRPEPVPHPGPAASVRSSHWFHSSGATRSAGRR